VPHPAVFRVRVLNFSSFDANLHTSISHAIHPNQSFLPFAIKGKTGRWAADRAIEGGCRTLRFSGCGF
jgi:hypothetical protein